MTRRANLIMLSAWMGAGCSIVVWGLQRRAELATSIEWNRTDLTAQPGARERLERERAALSRRVTESGIVATVGGAILLLGVIFNALIPWTNLTRKRRVRDEGIMRQNEQNRARNKLNLGEPAEVAQPAGTAEPADVVKSGLLRGVRNRNGSWPI
jgi:hypothetical protein